MEEDREEEKKSKLSIALEEDGYTGVSKYMKAFGLGYRGATEDYLNNKEAKEKDKRVEAAKQAEKIRKQLEEGSTKIGKTVDNTASEISTIQNTIKELKAADLPLEQKLKEINAEKNKLQFQFKTAYDRVNSDAKNYNMQNDNQYDLAVQSLNMLANDMDFSQNGRVEVDGKEFIVDREIANRHTELISAGKKSLLSVDDTGELVAKQVGQDGKFTDTVAPVAYQPLEEYTTAVEDDSSSLQKLAYKQYVEMTENPLDISTWKNNIWEGSSNSNPTKGTMVNKAIELNKKLDDGTITSEEKTELETIKKAYGMEEDVIKPTDFDKKIKIYDSIANTVSKYIDNPSELKSLNKSDINKMKLEEAKVGFKGLGETARKEISGTEASLNAGKLLVNRIDKLKEEQINRGLVDSVKQTVTTLLSDDSWSSMDEKSKQEALLTIGIDTSLGNALAQYIKSISGTAVAQAEYDRLRKIFTTGDYSNLPSLKKSISSFYTDLENSYVTKLRDSSSIGGSFILSKMKNYQDKYGDMPNPYDKKKPKKKRSLDSFVIGGK